MIFVKSAGFFQLIIIFILIIIILSLLGVSLSNLTQNPVLKENFSFLWKWIIWIWNGFLEKPVKTGVKIFIDLIWEPFVKVISGLKKE